ncbi:mitochondrial fission ELM1 family protein [Dyella sp. 2RAB6]|uniref:mitochondrial fission ELM1 family protein n=1 Tax=Dyella sp. 2RAB6 TaxID=3232992 RepID=UPI003F93E95D
MTRLHGECWVVTDGRAGNDRQALALAEALGLPFRHLVLGLRPPWSWFAPRLLPGGRFALPAPQRRGIVVPPWPAVVVGCGRTAAYYTRLVRELSEGGSYAVQILDPRLDPLLWDTVIAPRHDGLDGPNVLRPLGSLNPVDEAWLAEGREVCPAFGDLPQPRVAVLVGGPRKGIPIDAAYAEALATQLVAQQRRDGGSLLVLASRRTPAPVVAILRERLAGIPGVVWSNEEDGANPYPATMGWADRLVVTPDSINMLSEACAVGCPVQTLVRAPLPGKFARFHRALREAGLLHDLDDDISARQTPLRETRAIAETVRQRIAARNASRA